MLVANDSIEGRGRPGQTTAAPSQFWRLPTLMGVYCLVITASLFLAYDIRFDFAVPSNFEHQRLVYLGFVILVKLLALLIARQFGTMLSYFSLPDFVRILWASAVSSAALVVLRLVGKPLFAPPRSVLIVDFIFTFGGICATRLAFRVYRERFLSIPGLGQGPQQRIAIVGAGDAGAALALEFINNPSRGFKPVAFFDDDAAKHGRTIHGVPVIGQPDSLAGAQESARFTKVIIAIPSASTKRIHEVVSLASTSGLKVEILPSITELASGKVRTSRVRPVEVQDLLGRDPVRLDSDGIRRLIEGRVIMVTGAGGSIGSELCRQISSLAPRRLLMIDQSEGNLFLIEQELNDSGMGAIVVPLVADILDPGRIEHIFQRFRPEIVFHAAAHKHVYLMERQPAEAIANNVFGTRELARLASRHGVCEFIFISTDKAINPTSVMGATKRLAELQVQAMQKASTATKFMAVRFGNVLDSSGSVIPIFKRQIANGGPVTVTHPEVTRYFMTIPEAVGLVLQSAALGRGGEIFVLDMGKPVKIVDLARQMITLSGFKPDEDIDIKFIGLKPGEKLFEEYQHRGESCLATEHPRIMRFVPVRSFKENELIELENGLYQQEPNELKMLLNRLVPEYTPFLD